MVFVAVFVHLNLKFSSSTALDYLSHLFLTAPLTLSHLFSYQISGRRIPGINLKSGSVKNSMLKTGKKKKFFFVPT